MRGGPGRCRLGLHGLFLVRRLLHLLDLPSGGLAAI
jgi:hypothetical protein